MQESKCSRSRSIDIMLSVVHNNRDRWICHHEQNDYNDIDGSGVSKEYEHSHL
jgi:hypothetical protein